MPKKRGGRRRKGKGRGGGRTNDITIMSQGIVEDISTQVATNGFFQVNKRYEIDTQLSHLIEVFGELFDYWEVHWIDVNFVPLQICEGQRGIVYLGYLPDPEDVLPVNRENAMTSPYIRYRSMENLKVKPLRMRIKPKANTRWLFTRDDVGTEDRLEAFGDFFVASSHFGHVDENDVALIYPPYDLTQDLGLLHIKYRISYKKIHLDAFSPEGIMKLCRKMIAEKAKEEKISISSDEEQEDSNSGSEKTPLDNEERKIMLLLEALKNKSKKKDVDRTSSQLPPKTVKLLNQIKQNQNKNKNNEGKQTYKKKN